MGKIERSLSIENWVTTVLRIDSTSVQVARAMQKRGFPIHVDTSVKDWFQIYAKDSSTTEKFWEILEKPEMQVLWHVVEGLDPRKSEEFRKASFDRKTKRLLVAQYLKKRSEDKRSEKLMEEARKELPEDSDFLTQEGIQALVDEVVKNSLLTG